MIKTKLAEITKTEDHNIIITDSGTDAFILALFCTGVSTGDEVILPIGICASMIRAVMRVGAIPILIDVDYTLSINQKSISQYISQKTKAVLCTHPNGIIKDYGWLKVLQASMSDSFYIIEDCAQAFGGIFKEQPIGNQGDCSIYSFGKTKPVPALRGGALRVNGKICINHITYSHTLGEIEIEKLQESLSLVDKIIEQKQKIAKIYCEKLSFLGEIIEPRIDIYSNIFHRVIISLNDQYRIYMKLIIEEAKKNAECDLILCQEGLDVYKEIFGFLNDYYNKIKRPDLVCHSLSDFHCWAYLYSKYLYFRTNLCVDYYHVEKFCTQLAHHFVE